MHGSSACGNSFYPFEKWCLMATDLSSLDVSGVPEAYGLLYVIFQSVTVCSHIGQGSGARQLPLRWNSALSWRIKAVTTRLPLAGYAARLIWRTDSLIGSVRTAADETWKCGLALHGGTFCQKPGSNVIGLRWEIIDGCLAVKTLFLLLKFAKKKWPETNRFFKKNKRCSKATRVLSGCFTSYFLCSAGAYFVIFETSSSADRDTGESVCRVDV